MSAPWDLRRLQMHLQKRPPHPIYLLVGEEPFLIDEAVDVIRTVGLADGAADFNYDQFFAGVDDANRVRDTVEMLPMMSPRRVVLYKGVHALKAKDWDNLLPVLDSPVESTVLVFIAEKSDKRTKHHKRLAEKGIVVELGRPYDNQLAMWIEYIAKKCGLIMNAEAASLIRQFIGASLTEINSEMQKLRDFLGDRKEVTASDVLQVVSRSRADSVFDLTNAIGRKDRAGALQSLASLLIHGESEVGAVAMIGRHMRILSVIRQGIKAEVPPAKLCIQAGIPQFFLKDYQTQARLWSDSKIAKTIHTLKETDKALKSSPISSHIWLENFIIRTCDH